jgi:hypothetical protein
LFLFSLPGTPRFLVQRPVVVLVLSPRSAVSATQLIVNVPTLVPMHLLAAMRAFGVLLASCFPDSLSPVPMYAFSMEIPC